MASPYTHILPMDLISLNTYYNIGNDKSNWTDLVSFTLNELLSGGSGGTPYFLPISLLLSPHLIGGDQVASLTWAGTATLIKIEVENEVQDQSSAGTTSAVHS